ncbi:hypothetical protein PFJ02_22875 [Mycobacterium xenopi]|uniref:hypothetical protein n=1 Tax=Mycobacterium xenopi TaxID=1789 RepID=UPI00045309F7|nr:hypothetical protein [Mycobacterium xenopi]EUA51613.1 hypothetical protein I552_2554 [Mycobacterium xenopi 3993]MDA3642199.1 hypothetical protein [Mycobacterium xenopi]MDA3664823.1 hypothetical protein [Mycobacterium xenopi]ORX21780.1 hypothetical protein AWC32_21425 [Mycobacterium xenopi]
MTLVGTATAPRLAVERLDGAIVILTITRPHQCNALDSQALRELHRLLNSRTATQSQGSLYSPM